MVSWYSRIGLKIAWHFFIYICGHISDSLTLPSFNGSFGHAFTFGQLFFVGIRGDLGSEVCVGYVLVRTWNGFCGSLVKRRASVCFFSFSVAEGTWIINYVVLNSESDEMDSWSLLFYSALRSRMLVIELHFWYRFRFSLLLRCDLEFGSIFVR
uniref:Secreted protein n=1 Tax=Syphacia muris TaxID=451379 RepID=A0A0N5AY26_9BILA